MRGVVLVHGGFHGAWCWLPVQTRLEAAGITVRAPELPMTSLAADIDTARASIDELANVTGEPVVALAHSYGGTVLSGQDADSPLSHLVFAAAVAADAGESVVDAVNSDPDEQSALGDVTEIVDGWMCPIPDPIAQVLYDDCRPDDRAMAVARLRPQALACVTTASPCSSWRSVPSTYVVCDRDRALPPVVQRAMATRASSRVVTVASGHSVFLTQPDLLVELVLELARS
jgi:pimeloyl-ACP methyl ester carboxylesterase